MIFVLVSLWANGPAELPNQMAVTYEKRQMTQDEFNQKRKSTLEWIDNFAFDQALFRKQEVETIRARVSGMTPKQLDAWLEKTREIRLILESNDWRKINEWLRGYIPTYFDSSTERIEEFQKNAARMLPPELLGLIQRIQQEYEAAMSEIAARRIEIETLHRLARNGVWLRGQQQLLSVTRRTGRQQGPSNLPYFPLTRGAANRSHRHVRRYNVPLITSREVAGIAVRREIFGRYGYRW